MSENINVIQKLKIKLVNKFIARFLPFPFDARHKEYTILASLDDDKAHPSDYLVDVSLRAAMEAGKIRLDNIVQRFKHFPVHPNPNEWPGDHYRLLAAFVKVLDPATVIEIGTSLGTGTLALSEFMKPSGRVVTFDVVKWDDIKNSLFNQEDFIQGKIIQYTDDVSSPASYEKHRRLFEKAELIFVDAKKDGIMEKKFIEHFNTTDFVNTPIIIFDDIKHWPMLKIWRDIPYPKLDLTSLGHFTGTGIVEWNKKLTFHA